MTVLIQRAIRTPDGTILCFQTNSTKLNKHTDKTNNKTYVGHLDGFEVPNDAKYDDLSLYAHDPFDIIRERFVWGTYGINGDEEFKWVILKSMTTQHISAILITQKINDRTTKILKSELIFRDVKNF